MREVDMTDIDKVIEQAKADMLPYESWERLAGESSRGWRSFYAVLNAALQKP
jgi:hypothetical protein